MNETNLLISTLVGIIGIITAAIAWIRSHYNYKGHSALEKTKVIVDIKGELNELRHDVSGFRDNYITTDKFNEMNRRVGIIEEAGTETRIAIQKMQNSIENLHSAQSRQESDFKEFKADIKDYNKNIMSKLDKLLDRESKK